MNFISEKTYNHFNQTIIADETYKGLLTLSKQTPKIVERSKKQIFSYYQNTNKKGLVSFITPSGTQPGIYYKQSVLLVDLEHLIEKFKDKKKPLDIVKLALLGRVKVNCTFPDGRDESSWLYWGHKYKATVSGYNYGTSEDRFPKIRNPKLEGGGCKHLRAVMGALPFHANIITKDLIKLRVL